MNHQFSARTFLPLLGLGLLGTFSCTKETPTPLARATSCRVILKPRLRPLMAK
jgi:hypothetical protein